MLHIHLKDKGADKNQAVTDTDTAVGSALAAVQTSGLTGVGEYDCKISIVPVKVKSKKGHKIVKTYAFLDQGSHKDSLMHHGTRKSCGKLHCVGFRGSWPEQWLLL